jgi:hypothetical protein
MVSLPPNYFIPPKSQFKEINCLNQRINMSKRSINKIALEEQLIILVQGHTFLYDISSALYKMKTCTWTSPAFSCGGIDTMIRL